MKTQVRWTGEEVAILKEHGPEKLVHELAELLPRHTKKAISCKRRRLGVVLCEDYASRQGAYNRSLIDPDNLCKVDQSISFDDLENNTRQLILGSILGDASIKKNGSGGKMRDCWKIRNFIFYECHRNKQIEYTYWKASKLQKFLAKTRKTEGDAKSRKSELWTVSHPVFTKLRDTFYKERTMSHKSMIPNWVAEQMDEFALLIWYLDDGYKGVRPDGLDTKGNKRRPAPRIAAKGWDDEDLCSTTEILNERLGLNLYVYRSKHRDGINKIVIIPAADWRRLFALWQGMFEEHGIPECMRYKVVDVHEEE